MKLAKLFNLCARSFLVFIIAYLWLSFYINSIIAVFAISFLIMLVTNYGFSLLARRKDTRKALTREQQKHMQQINLQLKFMTRAKAHDLFRRAFEKLNKPYKNFVPIFNKEVTVTDVVRCIRNRKDTRIYIASERFSPEVVAFVTSLDADVRLLNMVSVYEQILVPASEFPEIKIDFKAKKRLTLQDWKRLVFSRAKVRPYIIIGIIVLLTSFIVNYSIYYITFASLLFIFALICLFARDTIEHEFI